MKLLLKNLILNIGELYFEYNANIEGGIFAVFGKSGSGKSTLLDIICGIKRPHKGRLELDDQVFADSDTNCFIPAHKRNIGVVFQEYYLFPHLNVEKNLKFGMKNKKVMSLFNKIISILELATLLKKKPSSLSGGEKARVAIGRALLQEPQLLLLDEPFANLDRIHREKIISYLLEINTTLKVPMIIISHDLEDILQLTNNLIIIEDKKIMATGHYIDLVKNSVAPWLLCSKGYLNIFDLHCASYRKKECLYEFKIKKSKEFLLVDNKNKLNSISFASTARLAISSESITLSTCFCNNISAQNQIKGVVSSIYFTHETYYITINCGISLISEITASSFNQLNIKTGCVIFCLFKAKSVKVVHVYE